MHILLLKMTSLVTLKKNKKTDFKTFFSFDICLKICSNDNVTSKVAVSQKRHNCEAPLKGSR